MNRKTTAAYTAVFQFIEANICKLNPISFMTDYECAMRNGLRAVYPDAELHACWFHYTQAVRRKASKMPNFFKEVAKDDYLNRTYHKFLALPLLPQHEIMNAYNMLKMAIQCRSSTNIFEEFLQYFSKQWLEVS